MTMCQTFSNPPLKVSQGNLHSPGVLEQRKFGFPTTPDRCHTVNGRNQAVVYLGGKLSSSTFPTLLPAQDTKGPVQILAFSKESNGGTNPSTVFA